MSIDLNMDMGALIKGLMGKQYGASAPVPGRTSKSPLAAYKLAVTIFVLVVLLAGIYILQVYLPLTEKNHKKLDELNKIIEMRSQLSVLDSQIATLKKKLDKSREEYLGSLAHFGNSEDLGALYQTVSTLSAKYNLVVLNVKELAPPPVVKPKAKPAEIIKDGKTVEVAPEPKKPAIAVKEIRVDIELKGHYGDYIKFKEDLASAEILLKINTESIMVKDDKNEPGSIYVKLNLSTYAIDKKPFQGIIADKENENSN